MKITAIHIKDFKRIKDVKLAVGADRSIILIGGRNGQGKSSTLDALTAAFGGKKSQPADPVRHGADEAEIVVELDDGELIVKRVISAVDGSSQLEVRDRMGTIKAPQQMLDGLIGSRFLDPLQFLKLPAKEQRATLMRLIDGADRIAGLDEKRGRAFTRRTEVGRDLTKAEGELARLPAAEIGAPIDVAALTTERNTIVDAERAADALATEANARVRDTQQAVVKRVANSHAIERLERELADLRSQSEPLAAEVKRCEDLARTANVAAETAQGEVLAALTRRSEIDTEIARAADHNRSVFAAEAQAKRRTEVVSEVEKLGAERDNLTKVIDTIDQRKAEILAAAKLPVEGLGVTDDGIELGGVPFEQASGAEKLRVALALAIAASPKLADVWIRDGALLDDESMALIAEHVKRTGNCAWIERVGVSDEGVVIIQDGGNAP